MISSLLTAALAGALSLFIMGTGYIISMKSVRDREKKSPFECGFDPVKNARLPFRLRFFLLAIIFLIFDVEIVLLFPMLHCFVISATFSRIVMVYVFLLILFFGLLYEWSEGSLNWLD